MLTRLFTAFSLRPAAAAAPEAGPSRPDAADDAGPADLAPAEDSASHMRALAECCTDGLSALAYAQFADLLEPPPLRSPHEPEPAARSR
jgi:hypothetical protein